MLEAHRLLYHSTLGLRVIKENGEGRNSQADRPTTLQIPTTLQRREARLSRRKRPHGPVPSHPRQKARATVVGLVQIELRTSRMRTSKWALLDMKCFKFEFFSANHLFTNNHSPSRSSHLGSSKFDLDKSYHSGSSLLSWTGRDGTMWTLATAGTRLASL